MSPTRICIALVAVAFATVVVTGAGQSAPPGAPRQTETRRQAAPAAATPDAAAARALIDKFCVGCHNERLKTANLVLDKADLMHVAGSAETWEKVVRKVKSGAMPPMGAARPDHAA